MNEVTQIEETHEPKRDWIGWVVIVLTNFGLGTVGMIFVFPFAIVFPVIMHRYFNWYQDSTIGVFRDGISGIVIVTAFIFSWYVLIAYGINHFVGKVTHVSKKRRRIVALLLLTVPLIAVIIWNFTTY
jgi:hypothetical protein